MSPRNLKQNEHSKSKCGGTITRYLYKKQHNETIFASKSLRRFLPFKLSGHRGLQSDFLKLFNGVSLKPGTTPRSRRKPSLPSSFLAFSVSSTRNNSKHTFICYDCQQKFSDGRFQFWWHSVDTHCNMMRGRPLSSTLLIKCSTQWLFIS